MSYKNKTENPISYALRIHYNVGKLELKKLKSKCYSEIEKLKTNRGSQEIIYNIIESRYPGFRDKFPLENWKQRKRNEDGTYTDVFISKTYEDSMNVFCKSITEHVNKYGKKSTNKVTSCLEEQLNIEYSHTNVDKVNVNCNDSIETIIALSEKIKFRYIETPDGLKAHL